MKYEIDVTEKAALEAEEAYRWISQDAPQNAVRWFNALATTIETLAEFPQRCPLAPENGRFQEEIRQLLYGNYRILFTIQGLKVRVLHIRHGARRPLRRPPPPHN